jgi:hypothetical protein
MLELCQCQLLSPTCGEEPESHLGVPQDVSLCLVAVAQEARSNFIISHDFSTAFISTQKLPS